MSYPENKKSQAIDRMVEQFCGLKEIVAELRVSRHTVQHQVNNQGYRRYWITEEEKQHLLKRRMPLAGYKWRKCE